jgi:hypothetical protein
MNTNDLWSVTVKKRPAESEALSGNTEEVGSQRLKENNHPIIYLKVDIAQGTRVRQETFQWSSLINLNRKVSNTQRFRHRKRKYGNNRIGARTEITRHTHPITRVEHFAYWNNLGLVKAKSTGTHTTGANPRNCNGGPDAQDGRNYLLYWNVRIFTGDNFQLLYVSGFLLSFWRISCKCSRIEKDVYLVG